MEEIVKSINETYEAFVTDSNAQIVKDNNVVYAGIGIITSVG